MMTIILTLTVIILIEACLSIDNAAVLALIVNKNLKGKERVQALRYGMLGAFIFRGLSLFFVSWILNNPMVGAWFALLGGIYLIRLGITGLTPKPDSIEEGEVKWADKLLNWLKIGAFWSTVIVVEFVDIVFSLDNLVAVVGLSKDFWIICVGVFIGIAIMRFVATRFSVLIERFPSLEKSAYIVIILLGVKLGLVGGLELIEDKSNFASLILIPIKTHTFDLIFSSLMMLIFFIPIIFKTKK